MPVPALLAGAAACGSLVTSIKSAWELRRMIKRNAESRSIDDEAPCVFRNLIMAYRHGILDEKEYQDWYEKFLIAKVEQDRESALHLPECWASHARAKWVASLTSLSVPAMHRVRAHIRIRRDGAPGSNRRLRDPEKRRIGDNSYSYVAHGQPIATSLGFYQYLPHMPEARSGILEWPRSAASIEYLADTSNAYGESSHGRRRAGIPCAQKPAIRSSLVQPRARRGSVAGHPLVHGHRGDRAYRQNSDLDDSDTEYVDEKRTESRASSAVAGTRPRVEFDVPQQRLERHSSGKQQRLSSRCCRKLHDCSDDDHNDETTEEKVVERRRYHIGR